MSKKLVRALGMAVTAIAMLGAFASRVRAKNPTAEYAPFSECPSLTRHLEFEVTRRCKAVREVSEQSQSSRDGTENSILGNNCYIVSKGRFSLFTRERHVTLNGDPAPEQMSGIDNYNTNGVTKSFYEQIQLKARL